MITNNFRLAVKGFIVKDNQLLIVKRRPNDVQKPGIWEIPGGRLEVGESPFDGLKREIMEETGLDIDVLQVMDVRHFKRADAQLITMLVFLCKTKEKNINLSEEHTDYEWVEINAAKDKITDFYSSSIDIYNGLRLAHLLK